MVTCHRVREVVPAGAAYEQTGEALGAGVTSAYPGTVAAGPTGGGNDSTADPTRRRRPGADLAQQD